MEASDEEEIELPPEFEEGEVLSWGSLQWGTVDQAAPPSALQLPDPEHADLIQLGQAYQALMERQDQALLSTARRRGGAIQLVVQVMGLPDNLDSDLLPAVEVHVPRDCTLGYLKRAVCRLSQGHLYPSAQRLYVGATGECMRGDSNTLHMWKLSHGGQLYLEVMEHDTGGPHLLPQVVASCTSTGMVEPVYVEGQGAESAAAAAAVTLLGKRRRTGAQARRGSDSEEGQENGERQGEGQPPPGPRAQPQVPGKAKKAAPAGSRLTNRFTEEEISAMAEGVRLYGPSWVTIKASFPEQLAKRTHTSIKDKWRNLQRGVLNNWRDEKSHISESTRAKIRQMTDTLQPQPAGASLVTMLPGPSSTQPPCAPPQPQAPAAAAPLPQTLSAAAPPSRQRASLAAAPPYQLPVSRDPRVGTQVPPPSVVADVAARRAAALTAAAAASKISASRHVPGPGSAPVHDSTTAVRPVVPAASLPLAASALPGDSSETQPGGQGPGSPAAALPSSGQPTGVAPLPARTVAVAPPPAEATATPSSAARSIRKSAAVGKTGHIASPTAPKSQIALPAAHTVHSSSPPLIQVAPHSVLEPPLQSPVVQPLVSQPSQAPASQAPASQAPASHASKAPASEAPASQTPASQAPVSQASQAPASQAPSSQAPASQAPASQALPEQAVVPVVESGAATQPVRRKGPGAVPFRARGPRKAAGGDGALDELTRGLL